MKSQKGKTMALEVTNWKTVFIGLILLLMTQNIHPELSNLMDSTLTPCPILYPYFIGYVDTNIFLRNRSQLIDIILLSKFISQFPNSFILSYFRGVCYHLGNDMELDENEFAKMAYCNQLQEPGRLAILPDTKYDLHKLTQVLDSNRFYQIGKSMK